MALSKPEECVKGRANLPHNGAAPKAHVAREKDQKPCFTLSRVPYALQVNTFEQGISLWMREEKSLLPTLLGLS